MRRVALVLAVLLVSPPALSARTWHINPDGTGDAPTIQAGIDSAAVGDTVQAASGTYHERLSMREGVSVLGSGARSTRLDGGNAGHVVTFNLNSGLIEGFTITGSGNSPLYSAGVFASQCSIRVQDCVVADNAYGITISSNSSAVIVGTTVVGCSGFHALRVSSSTASVQSCTIAANQWNGVGSSHSTITLENTIVAANGAQAVSCGSGVNSVEIMCSDLQGNASGDWTGCINGQGNVNGNFSADPLFCDPDAGDFHLQWGSPCLPANSPDGCGLIGAFGFGGCNSVSVTPESWARVKARYR